MWVAQLHAPSRNAEAESGVKRWLAESPAHAAAFERATEVWNKTGNLHAGLPQRGGADVFQKELRVGWALAAIGTCVCGSFVAALLLNRRARKQHRQ